MPTRIERASVGAALASPDLALENAEPGGPCAARLSSAPRPARRASGSPRASGHAHSGSPRQALGDAMTMHRLPAHAATCRAARSYGRRQTRSERCRRDAVTGAGKSPPACGVDPRLPSRDGGHARAGRRACRCRGTERLCHTSTLQGLGALTRAVRGPATPSLALRRPSLDLGSMPSRLADHRGRRRAALGRVRSLSPPG